MENRAERVFEKRSVFSAVDPPRTWRDRKRLRTYQPTVRAQDSKIRKAPTTHRNPPTKRLLAPIAMGSYLVSHVNDSMPARPQPVEPRASGLHPLSRARAGSHVIIRQLHASPEINQRLREMGFSEDRQIKLISLQSNILCQVCNARLGLNQRLAECIWVESIPQRAVA